MGIFRVDGRETWYLYYKPKKVETMPKESKGMSSPAIAIYDLYKIKVLMNKLFSSNS